MIPVEVLEQKSLAAEKLVATLKEAEAKLHEQLKALQKTIVIAEGRLSAFHDLLTECFEAQSGVRVVNDNFAEAQRLNSEALAKVKQNGQFSFAGTPNRFDPIELGV